MKLQLTRIASGQKYAQPLYSIVYSNDGLQKMIELPPGIPSRGEVVNALITEEYPRDRMEAVVNNYLLDMTDESSVTEFNAMQEYRREAKALADEILEQLNNESQ